ncbi:MAG: hypothetical protein KGN79_03705 [Acidobacteriota bacterium]|nr:hypothetical protein [Acidobacteriota bacterium]
MSGDGKENAMIRGSSDQLGIVQLCYSGHIAVRVRGVATGQLYQFSQMQPSQWVDRMDAPPLLQTPLFRELECQ